MESSEHMNINFDPNSQKDFDKQVFYPDKDKQMIASLSKEFISGLELALGDKITEYHASKTESNSESIYDINIKIVKNVGEIKVKMKVSKTGDL